MCDIHADCWLARADTIRTVSRCRAAARWNRLGSFRYRQVWNVLVLLYRQF